MIFHPRFERLCAYHEGELSDRGARRTARHLSRCEACRAQAAFLRRLRSAARELGEPAPPRGLLEDALARRSRGDRTVVPAVAEASEADGSESSREGPAARSHSQAPSPGPRRVAAAIVGLIGATAALAFFVLAREAAAGASELRFVPPEPRPGAHVRVEYRSHPSLAERDTLRLRARFRRPGDPWYNRGRRQTGAALLVRSPDGLFRGAFDLPGDVVFASFAVEDPEGRRVDHNGYALWEILVHGEDGRPAFEALEQRIADLMGRSWPLVYETARRMVALYPERVQSWQRLAFFEAQVLDDEVLDSLRRDHRTRLLAFHEELSGRNLVDADEMQAMRHYHQSATLGSDAEIWQYWRDRLDRTHPTHPWVLFSRENDLNRTFRDRPDRYLAAVEPLWRELLEQANTELRRVFVNNALNMAARAEDPGWFHSWIGRYRDLDEAEARVLGWRAGHVVRRDDLRPHALTLIREELVRLERQGRDATRSLDRTAEEQLLEDRETAAELLETLGGGLLAAGDTVAALDTLRVATQKAWRPSAWRRLGDARLVAGDTAGGLEALAAVSADPGTSAAFADSIRLRLGGAFDAAAWDAAAARARAAMTELVLAGSDATSVAGPVRLRSISGDVRTLEELSGGLPLVLIFWERGCAWSVMALADIQRAARWAGERQVSVVLVTRSGAPDEDVLNLIREKVGERPTFALFYDHRGEAAKAFVNFGTPAHFVLDADRRVVFQGQGSEAIQRIPLQVAVLLSADIESGSGGAEPVR